MQTVCKYPKQTLEICQTWECSHNSDYPDCSPQTSLSSILHEKPCREGCLHLTGNQPHSTNNTEQITWTCAYLICLLLDFSVSLPHGKASNCILEIPEFAALNGSVRNLILQVQRYNDLGEFLSLTPPRIIQLCGQVIYVFQVIHCM